MGHHQKTESKSTWIITRDGSLVFAENARIKYEPAQIGQVYQPRDTDPSRVKGGPKKLVEVTFAAGKWFAITSPEKREGRNRTMNLDSFFSRYIPGTPKDFGPKSKQGPVSKREETNVNLDAFTTILRDAKLDVLKLSDLEARRFTKTENRFVEMDVRLAGVSDRTRAIESQAVRLEEKLESIETKLDRLLKELGVAAA